MMLEWILKNLSTIVAITVVVVILWFILRFLRRTFYLPAPCPAPYIPPEPQRVEFSAFSPKKISRGSSFILDIWAYLPASYDLILRFTKELGRDALVGRKTGIPVEKGAILSIVVDIPGLEVLEPVDTIVWEEGPTNASFSVRVLREISRGDFPGKAIISYQGMTIGKLVFVIAVAASEDMEYGDRTTAATYPNSAFASYASENREEVFSRIHGMKKVAPDLDIFIDVFSLRSGQDWKDKLEQHVPTKDMFFLF